jgi:probable F420-dependent oxidoreductase
MSRPFRFIAPAPRLAGSAQEWLNDVRRIEELGYDTIAFSDHFSQGWVMESTVAMTAAAMATSRLRVLSLIFANDFRHPGILRKSLATLDVLSGGRVEFGLGTGWLGHDYQALGLPLDSPGVRVDRLVEAVDIVRALEGDDPVHFEGIHYRIDGLEGLPRTTQPRIPLLIGGGGTRILELAGRRADIVGVHPRLHAGRLGHELSIEFSAKSYARKIALVRAAAAAASRPAGEPEIQSTVYLSQVYGSDGTLSAAQSSFAEIVANDPAIAADSPAVLVGTVDDCIAQLLAWRDRLGISYWHLGSDVEAMAPIVSKLAGA